MPRTDRQLDGVRYIPKRPTPAQPLQEPEPTPVHPPKKRTSYKPWQAIILYGAVFSYALFLSIPYLPRLLTIVPEYHTRITPPPTETTLHEIAQSDATPIPGPSRLSVSSIQINGGQIFEGDTEDTLSKGIWHRPASSTPDKGGNTVLAAHRFQFLSGNDTFYNLDKVAAGDPIELIWNGKKYLYQVTSSSVVTSRAVSIEDNTAEPILTLYTCTPLWTSQNRLVVVAKLIPK
jgi:LPXTG-site transpeptidase (sortase) family protein